GKISSDGCLKKEQMVVSAIASTPQGILAKIWRPDSPPLRSRSRRLTLFNAVRKALSDNPSGLTLPIKKPKKTERIVTIVLPI
ncbi:hypothetical protein, partial [Escherichia coli]|uniref:hypothetical protein n=1 Tax=Escherichia coli TaxID=562 RepID=UPI001BC8BB4F